MIKMKSQEIKEMVNRIEQNFREYHALLMPVLEDNPAVNDPRKLQEIKNFCSRVAGVEADVIEMRLQKIQEEENPYIPVIETSHVKEINIDEAQNTRQIIRTFLNQRKELVQLLMGVPSDQWNRTGVHAEEGHLSFFEFVRRMIEKDSSNLKELRQKLKN